MKKIYGLVKNAMTFFGTIISIYNKEEKYVVCVGVDNETMCRYYPFDSIDDLMSFLVEVRMGYHNADYGTYNDIIGFKNSHLWKRYDGEFRADC